MAMMLVLLLLSITVGLCYAAMRSQFTAAVIQRNSDRAASARQAAVTGMTLAVKKMHRDDWAGVDSSLGGALGENESYEATYAAGDAELADDDPDQPYRVTIVATGYAVDPEHPSSIAGYKVRAVLRLIPRQLAAQPSDWAAMQDYTVFQTKKFDTEIDVPCRFVGKVRLQQKLKLALHYPNDYDARQRYLWDLNQMRSDGWPDYRTFTGPVYLPYSAQEGQYYTLLTTCLGATAIDAPADETNSDWTKPTTMYNYRIYQGGPVYAVEQVSYSLSDATLQPNVQTNPLGIFYREGNVSLYDNVAIHGSLFCRDEICFRGANVVIEPVNLPPLAGTSAPVQLAAASSQETTIYDGSDGAVSGLIAVFDDFRVIEGVQETAFSLAGKLVAKRLYVEERSSWSGLSWGWYYDWFEFLLYMDPQHASEYFPDFMSDYGCDPAPRVVIAPQDSDVTYHWANSYDPIFVPHPNDGGLRWDLLKWSEEQ
ncbi:MAG: hypothetical protein JW959_13480 [Pirellulales bacterium]|nr:hypothetical protein [Pirellulales bacterium]